MSDSVLRYLVAAVIAMLLIFQIGRFISDAYGVTWGVVSAVVVTIIVIMSARLAKLGGGHSFWFILPVSILVIASIIFMTSKTLVGENGWFDQLIHITPFVIGFCAPMVLLLVVYYALRSRVNKHRESAE